MVTTATVGGGCFWCLEAVYQQLDGVNSVVSGYMGGQKADPTYKEVCEGTTGHAEVVQLEFDLEVTSFRDILDVFFVVHDPTTRDRQGNDVGTQYRSVIFHHSERQREIAQEMIVDLKPAFRAPIVTAVLPASRFYPAEASHQDYFRNHGSEPYCLTVVGPKVKKFKEKFADRRRRVMGRP